MAKRKKRFADDGWAIWVGGDDTSTVYINDWVDPKKKSYVDLAIRIRGAKVSKSLYVYVPFPLSKDEIEDISLKFNDRNVLQAVFRTAGIVDYQKNAHSSEIAYNGKTIDIVHISTLDYELSSISSGTLIGISFDKLQEFLDNDEIYFIWRMPHKSLDEIFNPRMDVKNALERLRDLITTPVVSEKYGYSIRINESRLLPEEITRIGAFHRQKLQKAVVTISIDENYEINDSACYRISRLEENLYKEYLPGDYNCEDVITYQWNQTREHNLLGHFNFYNNITRNSVSRGSMLLYILLLLAVGVVGDIVSEAVKTWLALF